MTATLMNWRALLTIGVLASVGAIAGRAATLHTWPDSPAPAPPYASWFTAARTIQDAVDAAVAGDTVLVTNGVYAVGGRALAGALTNRVAIQKAITVRSVNGPEVTVIQGAAAPGGGWGDGAVRCAYVAGGAVVEGFTLTNGHTLAPAGQAETDGGGGAFCETNGALTNCVLSTNAASVGGGVCGGSLYACRIVGNRAGYGGGAMNSTLANCWLIGNGATNDGGGVAGDGTYSGSTRSNGSTLRNCVLAGNRSGKLGGGASGMVALYNCTLTGNSAGVRGGGVDETVLGYNCVVYYNQAPLGPNYSVNGNGGLSYSCALPLPAGPGNIDGEPQLASATHLLPTSPCVGTGSSAYASGLDIDGEPWALPPCVGADQVVPGPAHGALLLAIGPDQPRVVTGEPLQLEGRIEGQAIGSQWDFGDGAKLTNQVYQPFVTHSWNGAGTYLVKLTAFNADYPAGVVVTSSVEVVQGWHYVDAANPAPAAPYDTWATAAQTIEDAISAALPGGIILVTNGVYKMGGRVSQDQMTRVVIDKALWVQSVNGPEVTVIQGAADTRCAYVGAGAMLTGFTLTQGVAQYGGGAWCAQGGAISNCLIFDNRAVNGDGGGVYGGPIYNCRIERNTARYGGGVAGSGVAPAFTVINSVLADNIAVNEGGGASSCTLANCTVVGNRAGNRGGGMAYGSAYNSVVHYNTSPTSPNYADCEFRYSCTIPLPTGEGNLGQEPALASVVHLSSASPCIGVGSTAYATGLDIDGESWASPPCMGADQVVPANLVGPLSVAIQAERVRFADGFEAGFRARIEGRLSRHVWDFGDGTSATNLPYVQHSWTSPGRYEIRLVAFNGSAPGGVMASLAVDVIAAPAFYVDVAGTNPVYPYVTWETAATNIQQAVDASVPGRRVWVTNGVYETGGRAIDGITTRVAVDQAVRLESVNGPAVTVIRGGSNVRGVYLSSQAILSGFTVSGGQIGGDGGGIWAASDAVVTNAWIEGNRAGDIQGSGGGISGGILYNCRLATNYAFRGGGAHAAVLYDCYLTQNFAGGGSANGSGGGVANSTLYRCTLFSNHAHGGRDSFGGGANGGRLYNCLLQGNSAIYGGGAAFADLYHCTLVENTADGRFDSRGGGTYFGQFWDAIVYYNNAPASPPYANHYSTAVQYSCTTPAPTSGSGNTTAEPGFVNRSAADFHLLASSPCIDAGTTLSPPVTTDLDGVPRPLDGNGDGTAAFDMGAYEYLLPTADSNGDGIPDGWTWQYGLDPTDPNLAGHDPDLDGSLTGQEWTADTDPTNAASLFHIEGVLPGPPVAVTFRSSTSRMYALDSRSDLGAAPWVNVPGQTNVTGNGGLLTLVDTNPPAAAYYRVSVRLP